MPYTRPRLLLANILRNVAGAYLQQIKGTFNVTWFRLRARFRIPFSGFAYKVPWVCVVVMSPAPPTNKEDHKNYTCAGKHSAAVGCHVPDIRISYASEEEARKRSRDIFVTHTHTSLDFKVLPKGLRFSFPPLCFLQWNTIPLYEYW